MEVWKPLAGLVEYGTYYEVSNLGNVRSVDRIADDGYPRKGKILKPRKLPTGYLRVHLSEHGKNKDYYIHRLVAIAFIPNPDNLPQINHKSEIKTDNRVENLEWCDTKYNCNYGSKPQKHSEIRKRTLAKQKKLQGGI